MAEKVKILITSDCKVGGKHIDKGTIIDIDPDIAADRNNYAQLVHAGRVAEANEKNIAKVKGEIAAEAKIKAAHDKGATGSTAHEQIAAAVISALVDAGIIKPAKA